MHNNEEEGITQHVSVGSSLSRRSLPLLVLVFICTTALSLVYLVRERQHGQELAAARDQMNVALNQTRSQLQAVSAKLDLLSAAQQQRAADVAEPSPSVTRHRVAVNRRAARRPAEDPRWNRIQSQLSEQEKKIAGAQEALTKTRDDLEGKLNSTRDDLSGSIAKNHDELVSLQKRGERNYFEFQLPRSKEFQRVGPISLSLRKTDSKHKRYDLMMMVDDFRLEKKRVNLYEPVWINQGDRPQPVELVVNRIDKNQVQGYLSEPKYKKSELASSASTESKPQALQPR